MAASALLVVLASGALRAEGASSGTVVGATVPAATSLSTVGCAPHVAGITDFGNVLPGASAVTTSDCRVVFGSSNATATLRIAQPDGGGEAMWRPADGTFDPTYGGVDGHVERAIAGSDEPKDAIMNPDGSVVVAYDSSSTGQVVLTRFTPTGTVDTTFGASGTATLQVQDTADLLVGLARQPDGRILVAARLGTDAAIERVLADGGVDNSFGSGGVATHPHAGDDDFYGLVLEDDGSMLGLGFEVSHSNGYAVRFDSNGDVDTSFGSGGSMAYDFGASGDESLSVGASLPGGGYVLGGWYDNGGAAEDEGIVLRTRDDGSPDTDFSGDGMFDTLGIAQSDWADAISVLDDGRILVGQPGDSSTRIRRILADGSALDPSFGTAGSVTPPDTMTDMYVTTDGAIVATGKQADLSQSLLVRYDADGAPDPAFGTNGVLEYDIGGDETAVTVREWHDGTLRVIGDVDQATTDVYVASFAGAPVPDYDDAAGDDWGTAGRELFGACLVDAAAGATGSWVEAGTCTATDGLDWNDVPTSAEAVATTAAPTATATVDLRFGFRAGPARAAGRYVAPIAFTVVAP